MLKNYLLLLKVLILFFISSSVFCQPSNFLPLEGSRVTWPPSFSWTPSHQSANSFLNVSTHADFSVIDVIRWHDDGSHYHRRHLNPGEHAHYNGQTLYWRVIEDGNVSAAHSFLVGRISIDPHYNIMNINWAQEPRGGLDWFPLGWSPDNFDDKLSDLLDLKDRAGGTAGLTPDNQLAFSYIVPYLHTKNIDYFKSVVHQLCDLSEASGVPVFFALDGLNYWSSRPDLWRWWDDGSGKSFDPSNKANVEWFSWNQNDAVKNGWRHWGHPSIRVEPQPNIASAAVIKANTDALGELVPIIYDWYTQLPEEKKHLLAGVKVGWETGIGAATFYPKTPCILNSVPTIDGVPGTPIEDVCLSSNSRQLGYAALTTSGIKTSGEITDEDITAVVRSYVGKITEKVYQSGIPRRKIFSHIGVLTAQESARTNENGALSYFAHPGYSFYTGNDGPISSKLPLLEAARSAIGETYYGNDEWGGPVGKPDPVDPKKRLPITIDDWDNVFNKFINNNTKFENFFGKHYLNYSNHNSTVYFDALSLAVTEDINGWVNPPVIASRVIGNSVQFFWSSPSQIKKLILTVSDSPAMRFSGTLRDINVVNRVITGTNTYTAINLNAGTYYWKVEAIGVNDNRVLSDIGKFTVNTTVTAPGVATLLTPIGTITDTTPAYTWNAVSNSTWYNLWVNDATGTPIKQWYTAAQAGCASGTGTCSVTPSTTLAPGNAVWWIQTWNTTATGPWSAATNFSVGIVSPPQAANLNSPTGAITDTTPTYRWNAVSNSTWYHLWVNDATGTPIKQWYTAAQAGCASGTGTCSVTPSTTLATGNATWWIQTWNAIATGPWSAAMVFNIN